MSLRFQQGARVVCNIGKWTAGTVVKQYYREESWPEGKVVPYQVKLDNGKLIFAPMDDDRVIRALDDGSEAPEDFSDDELEPKPESEKTPVTIITGFLGAGKTTLINYILTAKHGHKIAVIENEFGKIGIDEDLVEENISAKEDIISLDNGCVCCTVRTDLIAALGQLAKRPEKFEQVIIETTGLADPAPVCFTFKMNAVAAENFRIDAIVTLVDAKHVEQHLDEIKDSEEAVNEAVQQVAFADKILLNKVDLVSRADLQRVKERLHSINSFAEIIETERSHVPLERILAQNSFNLERMEDVEDEYDFAPEPEPELCQDSSCQDDHDHAHAHGHDHDGAKAECTNASCTDDHGHDHAAAGCTDAGCTDDHDHSHGHGHDHADGAAVPKNKKRVHDLSGVGSVGLTIKGNLKQAKFNSFMRDLLTERARDIYRSKGVVSLEDEDDTKFVFQGVHEQIQFQPAKNPWTVPVAERVNKLVFIGRKLDRAELQAKFEACMAAD
jgi:G3E family GTPase